MIGVAGQWAEPEVFVKRPGFVVLGVNRERANTGNVRGLQSSLHRVLEHPGSQAFALPRRRDGEAREEHDGNWVTREALDQTLGSRGILHLADDQRIVANHRFTGERDVGLRSPGLLILECIPREKPVESFPAAIKFVDCMAAQQLFNPQRRH